MQYTFTSWALVVGLATGLAACSSATNSVPVASVPATAAIAPASALVPANPTPAKQFYAHEVTPAEAEQVIASITAAATDDPHVFTEMRAWEVLGPHVDVARGIYLGEDSTGLDDAGTRTTFLDKVEREAVRKRAAEIARGIALPSRNGIPAACESESCFLASGHHSTYVLLRKLVDGRVVIAGTFRADTATGERGEEIDAAMARWIAAVSEVYD